MDFEIKRKNGLSAQIEIKTKSPRLFNMALDILNADKMKFKAGVNIEQGLKIIELNNF